MKSCNFLGNEGGKQIILFKNINFWLIYCEVNVYMNYCTPQSLLNQVEMWRKEDVSRNLCVGSYQV